jgi:hypothetical protein
MAGLIIQPQCVAALGPGSGGGVKRTDGSFSYTGSDLTPTQECEIGKFIATGGLDSAEVTVELKRGPFGPYANLTVLGYTDGKAVLISTVGASTTNGSMAIDGAIGEMKEGKGRQAVKATKITPSFKGDEIPEGIKFSLFFLLQEKGYAGNVNVSAEVNRGHIGPYVKITIDGTAQNGTTLPTLELTGAHPKEAYFAFKQAVKVK